MSQPSVRWQIALTVGWVLVGLVWIAQGLFLEGRPWVYLLGLAFLLVAVWNVVQIRKSLSEPKPVETVPTGAATEV
jgi:hypothetical protein